MAFFRPRLHWYGSLFGTDHFLIRTGVDGALELRISEVPGRTEQFKLVWCLEIRGTGYKCCGWNRVGMGVWSWNKAGMCLWFAGLN